MFYTSSMNSSVLFTILC